MQESAAASDSLKAQANRLVEVVNLFDVGQEYIDVQAREIARETTEDTHQTASSAAALPSGRKHKASSRELPHEEKNQRETKHNHSQSRPQNGATPKNEENDTRQHSNRELRRPDLGQANGTQKRKPAASKEDDWEEF